MASDVDPSTFVHTFVLTDGRQLGSASTMRSEAYGVAMDGRLYRLVLNKKGTEFQQGTSSWRLVPDEKERPSF